MGLHLPTRSLFIAEEIDREYATQIIKNLLILSKLGEQPITIYLNCPGGDVEQGFAIYSKIKQLTQHVTIEVVGSCHSMATCILQAADHRRMGQYASFLVHDGETGITGHSRHTIQNWVNFGKIQEDWYEQILTDKIKQKHPEFTKRTLQHWLSRDTIFTAEKCLDLGLIDEIV